MSGQFPITAYVGMNGAGKTLAMVEELAVPAIAAGKPILANFRLNYAGWEGLRSWRQLMQFSDGVVMLDEISAVLPSRQSQTVPPQLLRLINQLRKRDVVLGWTAPAWARCDLALREVTRGVCVCKGYWRDSYQRVGRGRFPFRGGVLRDEEGKPVRALGWPPNCLFEWDWYNAEDFDEFSYGTVEKLKPASSRWYWRPAHAACRIYDTREGVDLLDHLDDSGACINCGGNRQRRKCECALESPIAPVEELRPVVQLRDPSLLPSRAYSL